MKNQSGQKALGRLRIAARLHENIKCVAVGIHGPPQPVLHAIDRDYNFVHVPLVVRTRSVPPDTSSKMRTEPVDPKADGFAADNDATFRQQILNICRAQREAMVRPNRASNDLTRKTKALQAWHGRWNLHPKPLPPSADANNLAMPGGAMFEIVFPADQNIVQPHFYGPLLSKVSGTGGRMFKA